MDFAATVAGSTDSAAPRRGRMWPVGLGPPLGGLAPAFRASAVGGPGNICSSLMVGEGVGGCQGRCGGWGRRETGAHKGRPYGRGRSAARDGGLRWALVVARGPLISIFSRGEKRQEGALRAPARLTARALSQSPPEGERFKGGGACPLSISLRGGEAGGRPQGAPLREGMAGFSKVARLPPPPPSHHHTRGAGAEGTGAHKGRPYGRGRRASMTGGGDQGTPHLNLLPGEKRKDHPTGPLCDRAHR